MISRPIWQAVIGENVAFGIGWWGVNESDSGMEITISLGNGHLDLDLDICLMTSFRNIWWYDFVWI